MAYLSLYRKYRPQFFADVVGQDHVVQTLQNALKSGHIANGYLFCGTRGVAKTTMARILAKGLNCLGADGSATVAQAEPCNVCAPCRAIAAGQAVDVVEMDAASNRSVNDIAKLRESVQFGPMENRYKVYIVDEAHQLSSDAKDAFLKTLEEPPANVVFILATTETHAIPITIASRCQRFDFKRGSISQIGKQVNRVLGYEKVTMQPDAVVLIARAADGSYRDGLSLLDQVLAFKRQDITSNDVAEVLGTVKTDLLAATIQKIADSDFAGVFSVSEEIFNQGKDVKQFLKTLSVRFRDMLFLRSGAKSADDDQTLDDPVLRQQSALFSPAAMLEALIIITEAERDAPAAQPHIAAAAPIPTQAPAPVQVYTQPPTVQHAVAPTPPPASQPSYAPQPKPQEPTHVAPAPPELVMQAVPAYAQSADSDADDDVIEEAEEMDRLTIPMFGLDNEPAALPPIVQQQARPTYAQTAAIEAEERELLAQSSRPEPTAAPSAPAAVPEELAWLRIHWSEAVNHMRVISPGGVPLMNDATPLMQVGNIITLEFTLPSYYAKLESPRAMDRLTEVINKVLKKAPKTIKIKAVLRAPNAPAPEAPLAQTSPTGGSVQQGMEDSPSDLLDEVISVFGGRIIDDGGADR
jgi:DNA polymerase-3 subunit gamma/tau